MSLSTVLRDRRLWIALAVIAVVVIAQRSGAADYLSIETLRTHREALTGWVGRNLILAAGAYVLVYTGAVAVSLPGAVVLTLTGGFLFGAVLGTFLTVLGATMGATLVFLFARSIFGDRALDRFGAPAAKIADGIRRDAVPYLLVLRLVPLFPFFLVNLVPAFVGVGILAFVATTFVGIIPGTAVFSLAGAGLGSVLDQGGTLTPSAILTPQILMGLGLLAVLSLGAIPVRRWLERRGSASAAKGSAGT